MPHLDAQFFLLGFGWYLVFVFSTCFHEASHAFASYKLGDPTAYHGGQVTLNPIPHILREPFGMVIVPIISFFIGGWMMGWASAPYDPFWAARHPKRAALMALAGPCANLLLVIISGLILRVGISSGWFDSAPAGMSDGGMGIKNAVVQMLFIFLELNLILFLFNMLPLPPFDGSGIPPLFLPDNIALKYLEFIRQPGFAMIGIIVAWNVFGKIYPALARPILSLIFGSM